MPRGVMRAMFRLDAGVGSSRYLKIEPAGPPGEPPDDAARARWRAMTRPLGAHVRDAAPASRDGEAGGGREWGAPFDAPSRYGLAPASRSASAAYVLSCVSAS
ncbi:hypothetical protein CFB52_019510 [Burkholderia sp. AU18528]|nr:hypothetical protein CFB52_019510 [Burkholderia sp. AU18528]RQV86939.1 hypothetical protein DF160_00190 [Burkholderia anthina]RQX82853.1 hypothetical protein DF034_10115 [Burkholderia anthina]WJN73620.1 hypothetical protein OH687_25240 [Burkholderia anthina]